MEPVTLVFVTLFALLCVGIVALQFRQMVVSIGDWLYGVKDFAADAAQSVADYVKPSPDEATSQPADEVSSSALAKPAALFADEDRAFAKIDIITALAVIKMIDTDGSEKYLSADKIAALVNMRAESVRELVRTARGTEPAPQEPYDPRKHIMVNGKEWIAR